MELSGARFVLGCRSELGGDGVAVSDVNPGSLYSAQTLCMPFAGVILGRRRLPGNR